MATREEGAFKPPLLLWSSQISACAQPLAITYLRADPRYGFQLRGNNCVARSLKHCGAATRREHNDASGSLTALKMQ